MTNQSLPKFSTNKEVLKESNKRGAAAPDTKNCPDWQGVVYSIRRASKRESPNAGMSGSRKGSKSAADFKLVRQEVFPRMEKGGER
jgi:hypothetical protein